LPGAGESDKIACSKQGEASAVPRILSRSLFLLAVALAAALAYGGWMLARLAPIGSAYAAKMLCSGVFVSGREPASVIAEDILADNTALLRLVQVEADRARQRTSATFLGFARREAQFRPALGCTLAIGTPVLQASDTQARVTERAEPSPLPLSAPEGDVDRAALQAALDWAFDEPQPQRLRRTRAVVVVHRGKIVAERYAPGFSADTPLPGWSMTKTVAALAAGMLVGEGRISLESHDLIPEWRRPRDRRSDLTVDQLLRMTDGLAFDESDDPLSDVTLMLLATGDAAGFAVSKPLRSPPGSSWRYASGTTNVLARALREVVGARDLSGFLRRSLLDRIGLQRAVLEPDAAGTPVLSSFMHATAREWAAVGQLLLQDGVWRGERLVPEGWVRYMRTPTPQCERRDFGAHLWLKVPQPFAGTPATAAHLPSDAFHLAGHEGQFVSMIESRDLVVVRMGLSRLRHTWDHETFLARVVQAFPGRRPRRARKRQLAAGPAVNEACDLHPSPLDCFPRPVARTKNVIVYNLLCDNAHRFEGWFASPEAFSDQHQLGRLACPVCGSSEVTKQLSAPHVQTRAREVEGQDTAPPSPATLQQIRKRVLEYLLKNTEDVGERFSEEARAIFYDEAPARAIRGTATAQEADELREEGIEVFTLPGLPVPPERLH
jgi:CubicO group peptidase (beta-lactamase class C family)